MSRDQFHPPNQRTGSSRRLRSSLVACGLVPVCFYFRAFHPGKYIRFFFFGTCTRPKLSPHPSPLAECQRLREGAKKAFCFPVGLPLSWPLAGTIPHSRPNSALETSQIHSPHCIKNDESLSAALSDIFASDPPQPQLRVHRSEASPIWHV